MATDIASYDNFNLSYKNSSLSLIPSLGCNITSLILDGQSVLDTNTDPKLLLEDFLCKSDFLAPFPNRISDGKYEFKGKTHQLKKNEIARGHAIHGLIIKKEFKKIKEVLSELSSKVIFLTKIKPDEFQGYPFHLQIEISFELFEKKLVINVIAINIGENDAPYGVGWHPYLKVGKKVDYCQFTIPAKSILEVDTIKELIPTGNMLANDFGVNKKEINETTFDTCFTDLGSNSVLFENIELFMDKSMKFVQVYTPDNRESIAVEPMSCAPDAFNNQMGIITLKPGSRVGHEFGIRIV